MSLGSYSDNAVPIGSKVASIKAGGGVGATIITNAVFDDISLNMPATIVSRLDEIGKENGWTMIANTLVSGPPVTGSGTVQVPTSTSSNQLSGCGFDVNIDPSSTATVRLVITDNGIPFARDGYYKVNVGLKLSRTPATA